MRVAKATAAAATMTIQTILIHGSRRSSTTPPVFETTGWENVKHVRNETSELPHGQLKGTAPLEQEATPCLGRTANFRPGRPY